MKTIIFIGLNKSGSSREAVKAAEQLGYHTVVFTDSEKQMQQRKEYPDVHQLIYVDTDNMDAIRTAIKQLRYKGFEPVAITSFVDHYGYLSSQLADEFCQNVASTETIYMMENKDMIRKKFSTESFTPKFLLIEKNIDINLEAFPLSYPVIVKSPTSTGSKDVLLATNENELLKHLLKLRKRNQKNSILVEEYVEGDQYLVEALVYNGHIHLAAIISQEITKGKRFIVTGYGVLAKVESDIENGIRDVIEKIVTGLNLNNGVFHLEMRATEQGWKLIEINSRISGGAMNKMIEAAFGFSLVKETIKMLIGEVPQLEKQSSQYVFTQYLIADEKGILEKVTGKARAMRSPGVVEVYVKPKKGTVLTPPLSMGHRYAYVIASGDSLEEARTLAKTAANKIQFHLHQEE